MFILRAAFWLSLVVFLIPSESGKGTGPAAGALQAIVAARGALADLAGMCSRQPEVCSQGGAALQAFGDHARVAVGVLYQTLGSQFAAAGNGAKDSAPQGTLRPADVLPAWRGPAPGGKA